MQVATSSFSEGFLDAPVLLKRLFSWLGSVRAKSEMERELASMDDRELADIGLHRISGLRIHRPVSNGPMSVS